MKKLAHIGGTPLANSAAKGNPEGSPRFSGDPVTTDPKGEARLKSVFLCATRRLLVPYFRKQEPMEILQYDPRTIVCHWFG